MSALNNLIRARKALIAGQPDLAHAAICAFQDTHQNLSDSDAGTARLLLTELAGLAEAGQAGIADARACVAGALAGATGVATYDSRGQRSHAGTDRRRAMRF